MNKFEQLIEYVVNDDMAKAKELFHDLCVDKSRSIYENILDEEGFEDADVSDEFADETPVQDFEDDIDADEQGFVEGEDEDDFMSDEGDEPEELEDRVVDLEDALDQLDAKFDEIINGDGEEDEFDGEEELGMEFDDDDEDVGDDEEGEFDVEMDDDMEDEGEEDFADDEMEETLMREYTEKVATPSGSKEVGAGGSVSDSTKSPIAKKREKGSIKIGGSEENGGSTPSTGSYAQGLDPKAVGKKVSKGPKASAPKPAKKETGVSAKSPVAKSRN